MRTGRPVWIAAALVAALAAAGCRAGEPAGRSGGSAVGASLLLVTLDTVRADRLGGYGYAAAETPTLDRLAREGVRFAAASTNAPLTLPAHASLLTGLLPPRHGLRKCSVCNGLAVAAGRAGFRPPVRTRDERVPWEAHGTRLGIESR